MPTKVIISYDGTANEDDALALGRRFGAAGAELTVAYVRHTHESEPDREQLAEAGAKELLARGAELLQYPNVSARVVTDRSTPEGLAALAAAEGAHVIVFCSDSHTAKGHVSIGNSAERLLEGGRTAIAIAPAGMSESDAQIQQIVAIGDGDGGARQTADGLAAAFGATVAPVANQQTDLLVVDSRADAQAGQVLVSSSAEHLIEIATCPVLVVPRDVTLAFGRSSTAVA